MAQELFIRGIDLHRNVGMPTFMIEDIIQRGCLCYNTTSKKRVNSISDTSFINETRNIGWEPSIGCHPDDHEAYEHELFIYRLHCVHLPIEDVIAHCKKAYGGMGSKEFVDKLHAINSDSVDENIDKPLDPRQRNTYLKMLAVTLCRKEDVSELEKRGLARALKEKGDRMGILFSEDSARSVIKQVVELVDVDKL